MPSFPPVQSVVRALTILEDLNTRRVTTVNQLHLATKLPKPTIVRLLETLVHQGFVEADKRLGGYRVTSLVQTLSIGFHGAPLVVEAGRAYALDLTRRLKWPVSIAVLDAASVVVRFSTIPDSPISPFHSTINMRLSLISRALGRAYIGFCPRVEREILIQLLHQSDNPEDHPTDIEVAVAEIVRAVRRRGFAERSPLVEPKSSSTIAAPIMSGDRVLATVGITYFRSALPPRNLRRQLVDPLLETARLIERSVAALGTGEAADEDGSPPVGGDKAKATEVIRA